MKKNLIAASFGLLLALPLATQAATIQSTSAQISAANIDKVISLVNKVEPGYSHKKVNLVLVDHGMSTDLSPRYSIYFTYASFAEMGNLTTQFMISQNVLEFVSATRISAGVYSVTFKELNDQGQIKTVSKTIDSQKMFIDEQRIRSASQEEGGDAFADGEINTTIELN